MTKREIMIEKLLEAERRRLEKKNNDGLIDKITDCLTCSVCPLDGDLCDKYPYKQCSDAIKAWANEGGNDGNNN